MNKVKERKRMGFQFRRLHTVVEVHGKPVFGWRKAYVRLMPAHEMYPLQWRLRRPFGDTFINANTVTTAFFQNLAVVAQGETWAHVIEHLLPLRALGLLGATIESSHCLPYTGSTEEMIERVLEASDIVEQHVPIQTVRESYIYTYPKPRGERTAFTSITPRNDGRLIISIIIKYPGLGSIQKLYNFPDDELIATIGKVKAQGWPRARYWPSKMGSILGIWQHHNNAVWPQRSSNEEVIEQFAHHRCLDLLGTIGLLMNGGFLSANVTSVCSGHVADLQVCRQAMKGLVTIS